MYFISPLQSRARQEDPEQLRLKQKAKEVGHPTSAMIVLAVHVCVCDCICVCQYCLPVCLKQGVSDRLPSLFNKSVVITGIKVSTKTFR